MHFAGTLGGSAGYAVGAGVKIGSVSLCFYRRRGGGSPPMPSYASGGLTLAVVQVITLEYLVFRKFSHYFLTITNTLITFFGSQGLTVGGGGGQKGKCTCVLLPGGWSGRGGGAPSTTPHAQ